MSFFASNLGTEETAIVDSHWCIYNRENMLQFSSMLLSTILHIMTHKKHYLQSNVQQLPLQICNHCHFYIVTP